MGVLTKPLAELTALEKGLAIAEAYGAAVFRSPFRLLPKKRLTETYLRDPAVANRAPAPGENKIRMVR